MGTIKDIDLNTIPCTSRISQGFEQLARILETDTESSRMDFDVVIIGSGYGGAIACSRTPAKTGLCNSSIPASCASRKRSGAVSPLIKIAGFPG